MGKFTHEKSRSKSIFLELEKMEVGQQISKTELILSMYDYHDWFVMRSFDVLYCKAKKQLPGFVFKCESKIITRIS